MLYKYIAFMIKSVGKTILMLISILKCERVFWLLFINVVIMPIWNMWHYN
jgi:hypothetical protein